MTVNRKTKTEEILGTSDNLSEHSPSDLMPPARPVLLKRWSSARSPRGRVRPLKITDAYITILSSSKITAAE